MFVSTSARTDRPCNRMRTIVRSADVEMTTPLSPANGPKVIVTTVPLVTVSVSPQPAYECQANVRIVREFSLKVVSYRKVL